jgi:hypothetical protein
VQLQHTPGAHAPLANLVGLLFAVFALGIARSWELLGSRQGGIFGWLSPLSDVDEDGPKMTADGAVHPAPLATGAAEAGTKPSDTSASE